MWTMVRHHFMHCTAGSIPQWLTRLSFPWVDLANNNLTGTFPNDWAKNPMLRRLNVKHNFLTGTLDSNMR